VCMLNPEGLQPFFKATSPGARQVDQMDLILQPAKSQGYFVDRIATRFADNGDTGPELVQHLCQENGAQRPIGFVAFGTYNIKAGDECHLQPLGPRQAPAGGFHIRSSQAYQASPRHTIQTTTTRIMSDDATKLSEELPIGHVDTCKPSEVKGFHEMGNSAVKVMGS